MTLSLLDEGDLLTSVGTQAGVPVRVDAGADDVREMRRLVGRGVRISNEQFEGDHHLNEVIPKPWGFEYRAFADDFFDLWVLHLDVNARTSMHMHPRKLTYLICLAGQGIMSRFGEEIAVTPGTIVRIGSGAFHATANTGDEPLELVEVEVPRNKFDLLRLQDSYNRAGTAYETASQAAPEHPIRRIPQMPSAHLRDRAPDDRYEFSIRAGMDIFYRRRARDLFYIPLCVSGVVYSDVDILARHSDSPWQPQTDIYYLCISQGV